jgi:putative ABC transport system permease protein
VQCKVIGVVKDFYFQSLHQEIGPMFIFLTEKANDFLNIRIAPEDPQAAIGMIRQGWELMNPNVPFIYYTLEEHLADQYVKEEKLRQFIGYFALLSVFISLLGLFGLSSFMIDRKTKNVGIRKVLGASAASLVYLLVREFLWLILIAWIVAVPVGWLLMDIWLQHFAYRIRIGWVWFALSGLIVLIMAMATVIFQTYKAANSNPVDVVKYE